MNKVKGLTLIELVLALAIAGILLGIGLPALDDFVDKSRIKSEITQLRKILQHGREIAITQNKKVTICPISSDLVCSKSWTESYISFIDFNENRIFDAEDLLLDQHKLSSEKISIRWTAFGIRSSFQWHHTGITNHQNGLFELCFKHKPELTRAIIISKSGRLRHSTDTNGNNIHENASGQDLNC